MWSRGRLTSSSKAQARHCRRECGWSRRRTWRRSEEHTSELQSRLHLVCRLLLDTSPPHIYTLSLHDALPISIQGTITLVSLSPDGENARVLLRFGDERIFVDVEPRSVDQFFESTGTALQARVRVVEAPDLAKIGRAHV